MAGKLRATETKVSENLCQEAFLIPAYPSSLKRSQAVLPLASLAYHRLLQGTLLTQTHGEFKQMPAYISNIGPLRAMKMALQGPLTL